MKWRYRKYKLWVINTQTEANLYIWDKWKTLLPTLDRLINLTSEQAFIRSFQSYEYENQWLGFGRMKWNEENNIKWTTKYRNSNGQNKTLAFYHTEIWAPDWNRVCDGGIPPDIFIKLYHFPTIKKIREGLVIAIPKALYNKNKVLVENELIRLVNEITYSTISTLTRYWWPGWKFRNQIDDINNWEIERIVEGKI